MDESVEPSGAPSASPFDLAARAEAILNKYAAQRPQDSTVNVLRGFLDIFPPAGQNNLCNDMVAFNDDLSMSKDHKITALIVPCRWTTYKSAFVRMLTATSPSSTAHPNGLPL